MKALEAQLLVDLRSRPVHQHQPDAQGGQQRKILHQVVQGVGLDELAAKGHDERFAAKRMDIRGHVTEPAHELRRGEFWCFLGGDCFLFQ